jgi:ATP synthase subunit 6
MLRGLSYFLAHLVPLGTPYLLIPLIVIIELVRGLIRPLTLGVRLVANIVAGHLLIILLRSPLRRRRWSVIILGLGVLVLLLFLERGVSIIQGYVFSLLSSLYLAESNWRGLNY